MDNGICDIDALKQGKKFLLIERKDGQSLARVSPFAVEKAVSAFGEIIDIVRRSDGKLLLEARDKTEADKIAKITHIEQYEVSASSSTVMNTCKAIVRDDDMIYWDQKELLEKLADQGVIDIKNIKSRRRNPNIHADSEEGNNEVWFPTPMFIITFDLPSRPPFLKVGYAILETRDYIPDPIRCFKCQRFGHFRTSCKNVAICVRCSEVEHRPDPCKSGIKCVNCGGPHFASWRICPVYAQQFEIQKISTTFKVPFNAATKIYKTYNRLSHTLAETIARGDKIQPRSPDKQRNCNCPCSCDSSKRAAPQVDPDPSIDTQLPETSYSSAVDSESSGTTDSDTGMSVSDDTAAQGSATKKQRARKFSSSGSGDGDKVQKERKKAKKVRIIKDFVEQRLAEEMMQGADPNKTVIQDLSVMSKILGLPLPK